MVAKTSLFRFLLSTSFLLSGCLDGRDGDGLDGDALDGDELETKDGESPIVIVAVDLPDLIVTIVSDPPSSATLGTSFQVTETVTNQGAASAGSSYTKYYLSANGTSPLYFLGNRSVPAIDPQGGDTGTATATIPGGVAQGNYRVLACADSSPGTSGRISQVAESDENNNCTASVGSVSVTGPDLVASGVSVSPSTINASTGTLTVTDTVTNTGAQTAGASITRWYLSTDTIKNPEDVFIRNCVNGGPIPGRNVNAISGGGSSTGSASTGRLCIRDEAGLHPPASGTYYVVACADSTGAVLEISESNNCAVSSNTVQVTGGVDLIQTAIDDPPSTGAVGTTFSITETVQNVGGDTASSSFSKFYLSTNGTSKGPWLGSRSVSALTTNASSSATTALTIQPLTPSGTYRILVCADGGSGTGAYSSQIAETNENNNCRASTGTISIGSPDLVITFLSDPPPLLAKSSLPYTFPIVDTTQNIGATDTGAAFYNKYYLSTNGMTPNVNILVAPGTLAGPLAAGGSQQVTTTGTIPASTPIGTYWLLACTDYGSGTGGHVAPQDIVESNENNNCRASANQMIVQ